MCTTNQKYLSHVVFLIGSRKEDISLSPNKERHGILFKQTWIHITKFDLSSGTEFFYPSVHIQYFPIYSWKIDISKFTTPKGACVVVSLDKIGPVILGGKFESLECNVAYISM